LCERRQESVNGAAKAQPDMSPERKSAGSYHIDFTGAPGGLYPAERKTALQSVSAPHSSFTQSEWKSQVLRNYQRRTRAAHALIAGAYLAGTNTRRVSRALRSVFGGEVDKDTVSRVWRKVKGDWDAWNSRSLADEPIVRLILDGTVVRVRLDLGGGPILETGFKTMACFG
jgi:Transposase, Mutator family